MCNSIEQLQKISTMADLVHKNTECLLFIQRIICIIESLEIDSLQRKHNVVYKLTYKY